MHILYVTQCIEFKYFAIKYHGLDQPTAFPVKQPYGCQQKRDSLIQNLDPLLTTSQFNIVIHIDISYYPALSPRVVEFLRFYYI